MIKRGIRNTNGKLGATIDDEDICKRDSDGIPRFFNPDTGREFTGDNPRRQAQEWVEDYNKELAEVFDKVCNDVASKMMEEEAVSLQVIEFASKYDALDPVRRGMLESIIEDYEVTDDKGDLVGYSIDLDKALAIVERQVGMIRGYASQHASKPESTSPALDMPSHAGQGPAGKPKFNNLAEAMEWEQDQLLSKMKGNAI